MANGDRDQRLRPEHTGVAAEAHIHAEDICKVEANKICPGTVEVDLIANRCLQAHAHAVKSAGGEKKLR